MDSDGAPPGLTSILIRERSGDSLITTRRLTDRGGRLVHRLASGNVTVVARRPGFRADSARIVAETLRAVVTLQLARLPQLLATQLVRESADCSLPASHAAEADESLWEEVVKGIEACRLLRDTYRFEQRVIVTDPQLGESRAGWTIEQGCAAFTRLMNPAPR